MSEPEESSDKGTGKGTGFWAVVQSVLAAGLGVQSSKNRARDFNDGRALHFIVGGLVGTILFVLAIVVFVSVIIRTS